MKKHYSCLLVFILSFSIFGYITPVSGNHSVTVDILDAWYDDLDGDGRVDDIGVDVLIYLQNYLVYTDVDLYLGIELPSGKEFWFKVSFTVKKYTVVEANGAIFSLYNTAIETGWYKAHAIGFAEGDYYSYMDTHIFDPPGSNAGNPSGSVRFYSPSA